MQRAIHKNSGVSLYWCSVGVMYASAMQAQDAFECFVKATNLDANHTLTWLNMGILYEHCKQQQEAKLAYEKALNLDPSLQLAIERIARIGESDEEEFEDIPEFV